jgi:hypothetical protein
MSRPVIPAKDWISTVPQAAFLLTIFGASRAEGPKTRSVPPRALHAIRIDPNVSATTAGAYIAKGGDWKPAEEMTRGDVKPAAPPAAHYSRSSLTTTRPATHATGSCGLVARSVQVPPPAPSEAKARTAAPLGAVAVRCTAEYEGVIKLRT